MEYGTIPLMTTLEAANDRLILKMDDKEEISAGGIHLAQDAQEKPRRGTVVSVGPGVFNDKGETNPMSAVVGDRAIVSQWAGNEFKFEGQEYVCVHIEDVMAWIRA